MLTFSPTFPPPSSDDIERLESEIGYALPQDYIQFLSKVNGGMVCGSVNSLCATKHIYDVDYLFGLDLENINPEEKHENLKFSYSDDIITHSFPKNIIRIGSGVIHDSIMSLKSEDYGHIYCGHREEGEEHDYTKQRARVTSNAKELEVVGYRLPHRLQIFLNECTKKRMTTSKSNRHRIGT